MGRVKKRVPIIVDCEKPGLTIIGIDPGTVCGYGVLRCDPGHPVRLVSFGVFDIHRGKSEGGGMQMVRLTSMFTSLVERYLDRNPVMVYEEITFHSGVEAAHVYGAVSMKLMEICEHFKIPYTGMYPSTIRKIAFGKGNVGKDFVKRVLQNRFNVEFKKEDESDAVACGLAYLIKAGMSEICDCEGFVDEPKEPKKRKK